MFDSKGSEEEKFNTDENLIEGESETEGERYDEEVPEANPAMDSPDMFVDDSDTMEVDEELTWVKKEEIIHKHIEKFDINMLENERELPDFVTSSRLYKRKKEDFLLGYVKEIFASSSSQEVAEIYSQLPEFVREHEYTKQRLNSHEKEQLSNWRLLKNINDTLKELQKDNSTESYKQRVMIVASAYDPRYGLPKIEETRNVIDKARDLREICSLETNQI